MYMYSWPGPHTSRTFLQGSNTWRCWSTLWSNLPHDIFAFFSSFFGFMYSKLVAKLSCCFWHIVQADSKIVDRFLVADKIYSSSTCNRQSRLQRYVKEKILLLFSKYLALTNWRKDFLSTYGNCLFLAPWFHDNQQNDAQNKNYFIWLHTPPVFPKSQTA
jgi:hypothetical protein